MVVGWWGWWAASVGFGGLLAARTVRCGLFRLVCGVGEAARPCVSGWGCWLLGVAGGQILSGVGGFMVRSRRPAVRRCGFHGQRLGQSVHACRFLVRRIAGVPNRQRLSFLG